MEQKRKESNHGRMQKDLHWRRKKGQETNSKMQCEKELHSLYFLLVFSSVVDICCQCVVVVVSDYHVPPPFLFPH